MIGILFLLSWVLFGYINYRIMKWYFCDEWDPDFSDILFVGIGGPITTQLLTVLTIADMIQNKQNFATYFKEQIEYHNEKKNHNNYYYDWRDRLASHKKYIEENEELKVDDFKEMF